MWYAVKVRSQKEFEVEAALVEMGIDVWLPRRKQFVRSGTDRMPKAVVSAYIPGFMFVDIPPAVYRSVIEIKWVSPRMLPVLGIETANAKNTSAGVSELGSLGQMRTLRREVEAEFAEATRIEEAANAEWERSGNRKSYMEVVKQYRTGQAIQAIDDVSVITAIVRRRKKSRDDVAEQDAIRAGAGAEARRDGMTPEDFKAAMQADKEATRAKWQGMVDEVFGPREAPATFDDIVRCECGSTTKCGRADCRSPWAGAVAYGDVSVSSGKAYLVTTTSVSNPETGEEMTHVETIGAEIPAHTSEDSTMGESLHRIESGDLAFSNFARIDGIDIDGKFHPVRTRAFERTCAVRDGKDETSDWKEIEVPASKAAEILAAVDGPAKDADAAFWAHVPEGYDWVAMDADGWVGACSAEPGTRTRSWASPYGQWRCVPALNNYHPRDDWQNSLRRRPEGL